MGRTGRKTTTSRASWLPGQRSTPMPRGSARTLHHLVVLDRVVLVEGVYIKVYMSTKRSSSLHLMLGGCTELKLKALVPPTM